MSTSLSRRIRRIGLLPQVALFDVLDENQRTKLTNAHNKVTTANERYQAALERNHAVKTNTKSSEVEKTAAKNMLADSVSEQYAAEKYLKELTDELQRKLNPVLRPRTELTVAEVAAEADKLTQSARAKRKEAEASRSKAVAKAFAPKKVA